MFTVNSCMSQAERSAALDCWPQRSTAWTCAQTILTHPQNTNPLNWQTSPNNVGHRVCGQLTSMYPTAENYRSPTTVRNTPQSTVSEQACLSVWLPAHSPPPHHRMILASFLLCLSRLTSHKCCGCMLQLEPEITYPFSPNKNWD